MFGYVFPALTPVTVVFVHMHNIRIYALIHMLSPAFPSDSRTLSGLADSDLDVFAGRRFRRGNATLLIPLIRV